jgi:hypothetical protein
MAQQPLGGLGLLMFRGFTITHFRHTTLGRTPLDEGPAARYRDLYLTTHNTRIHALGGIFFVSFDLFCTSKSFRPSSCHLCSILLSLYNKHNTNIHATGGIRTHNPRKRTAADQRLRTRSHWDRRRDHLGKLSISGRIVLN